MINGGVEKKSIYIVLNPIAGHSSPGELRKMLEDRLNTSEQEAEVYETTGQEDVAELTRQACQKGSTLVVAAGGDGTVAGVVNGLLETGIPLGIIPVGTGNALARSLGIPLNPEGAVDLITGSHVEMELDAMGVGKRIYMLNVSAGISAQSMRATPPEEKKRFGVLAYSWQILKQLFGYQPHTFQLRIDDHDLRVSGTEVLVSNGTLLREPPFPTGPREHLNDGEFDVYILTARSIWDYLRVIWDIIFFRSRQRDDLHHVNAQEKVGIRTLGTPQAVQADGEVIGQTPVEVKMIHNAIRVIVPEVAPGEKDDKGE